MRGLTPPLAHELQAAVATMPSPLHVELLCSLAMSAWGDAAAIDYARPFVFADLLEELRDAATPEALALLRGLALVAWPNDIGEKTELYADELTAAGVAMPPSMAGIGTAEFASAWILVDDEAGEEELFVNFDYLCGRDHAIAVLLEDDVVTEIGCAKPQPIPEPDDPGLPAHVAGAILVDLLAEVDQFAARERKDGAKLLAHGALAYARAQSLLATRTA